MFPAIVVVRDKRGGCPQFDAVWKTQVVASLRQAGRLCGGCSAVSGCSGPPTILERNAFFTNRYPSPRSLYSLFSIHDSGCLS